MEHSQALEWNVHYSECLNGSTYFIMNVLLAVLALLKGNLNTTQRDKK